MKRTAINLVQYISTDSLYNNSFYIMASTGVMSFFGFIFWMLNARLYSPTDIGLATALISSVSLINGFCILGMNSGMIRFLPKINDKNSFINTIFTSTGIFTLIGCIVYLILLPYISPKLLFIRENIYLTIFFVLFVTLSALNTLSDSVFIALRSTKFILVYNTLYSISRVIFPLFLISLGVFGIFFSHTIGVVIALSATLYFLIKKFHYSVRLVLDKRVIDKIASFSLASFTTSFLGGLPTLVFPLLILDKLGAATSAYYYIVAMIANLLNIIPLAISQSLFAESAHDEATLRNHIRKSILINAVLLIPAVIFTLIFGKYLLLVFGESYSAQGSNFLQLMALSVLFSPVNNTFSIVFRIKNHLKMANISVALGAIVTITMSYLFINLGITGVGYAIILGQLAITLVFLAFIFKLK